MPKTRKSPLMFALSRCITILVLVILIVPSIASESHDSPSPVSRSQNKLPRGYVIYQNDRFNFQIAYPKTVLHPGKVPSEDGAGEVFSSKDGKAELCVCGQYNTLSCTLKEMMEDDVASEGKAVVTMKRVGGDWYVVSGTVGSTVFYIKGAVRGDQISKFIFKYPFSQKSTYDSIVTAIEHSFIPGPN